MAQQKLLVVVILMMVVTNAEYHCFEPSRACDIAFDVLDMMTAKPPLRPLACTKDRALLDKWKALCREVEELFERGRQLDEWRGGGVPFTP
jgi:hypothetical protein